MTADLLLVISIKIQYGFVLGEFGTQKKKKIANQLQTTPFSILPPRSMLDIPWNNPPCRLSALKILSKGVFLLLFYGFF